MTATAKASKKTAQNHPPFLNMIQEAIVSLKECNGSSRQAIIKYITSHFKVDTHVESHVRRALLQGLKSTKLVHTKGKGASGSFKLAENVEQHTTTTKAKATKTKKESKEKTPSKTKKETNEKTSVSKKKEKTPAKATKKAKAVNKAVKAKKSTGKNRSPVKAQNSKAAKATKVAKPKARKFPKKNPSSRQKKIN
ncbi:Histone H1.0 [Cichlidogyrus casuarinus]|uniref:Histone H1.0 n=1 Tax=Cichlidogyrus casuarinus TaxID=1844966 RepID=A0ABD2QJN4_9PLAT